MIQATRTLADYFPDIDLPELPMQEWAVVQLKRAFEEEKTAGGIIIPGSKASDEKGQQEWHETLARVVAAGPAFQKNRETLEPWPECKDPCYVISIGDFVRIPEFISARFTVRTRDGVDIKCISIRDVQIMRKVVDVEDAMKRVKAYVPLAERKY